MKSNVIYIPMLALMCLNTFNMQSIEVPERQRVAESIEKIEKAKEKLDTARDNAAREETSETTELEKKEALEAFKTEVDKVLLSTQQERYKLSTIKDPSLRTQLEKVIDDASTEAIKDQAILRQIQQDISDITNPARNTGSTIITSAEKKAFDALNTERDLLITYLEIGINPTEPNTQKTITKIVRKIIEYLEEYKKYRSNPAEIRELNWQINDYKKLLAASEKSNADFVRVIQEPTFSREQILSDKTRSTRRRSVEFQQSNFDKIKNWLSSKQATLLSKVLNFKKAAEIRDRLYKNYQSMNNQKALLAEQPQLEILLSRIYKENLNYLNKYYAEWQQATAAEKKAKGQIYIDTLAKTVNDLLTLQWTIREKYMTSDLLENKWRPFYDEIGQDIEALNQTLGTALTNSYLVETTFPIEQSTKVENVEATLNDTTLNKAKELKSFIDEWQTYKSVNDLLTNIDKLMILDELLDIYQNISTPLAVSKTKSAALKNKLEIAARAYETLATSIENIKLKSALFSEQEWSILEKELTARGASQNFRWAIRDLFFETSEYQTKYPTSLVDLLKNLSRYFDQLALKIK